MKDTDTNEENKLQRVLNQYLPAAGAVITDTKTCLYANSPDEHFMIGKLSGYDGKVIVAAGFSGHGFKFVPVVGEIVADLATKGAASLPVAFLNPDRFLPK
jgi:sarcosine oxidase